LELIEVAPGAVPVTAILTRLADACAGHGSALGLVAAGSDEYARRMRAGVGFGSAQPAVEADVALVVSTSGSLGEPKGVMLSAEALLSSAHAAHEFLGGPGGWLLALPITSIGGIQVLMRSLIAQSDPVILNSIGGATPFDPSEFAAKAWTLDPSLPAYCSLVPTQIARILEHPDGLAALQGFDAVLVGGARMPTVLAERLNHDHVQWYSTYGMTESSGGLFYDGLALPGARVTILDPDSDGVGRILLHGPMIARGYFNDAVATAEAFRDDSYLTSDLGSIHDGHLTVLGRIDDVVQIGGINVSVNAVEEILRRHYKDVAVLATPDDEWGSVLTAYVVEPLAAGQDDHLDDIDSTLGRPARPRRVVPLDQIPYLANGKVDRAALAAVSDDAS
jgi:O-succinylbenzoic acid--CoA ligase